MTVEAQNLEAGMRIRYMEEEWIVESVEDDTDTTCRVRAQSTASDLHFRSWVVSRDRAFEVLV